MKCRILVASGLVLFAAVLAWTWWPKEFIKNPDPNHTHADVAVWVDGKKIDFSLEKYMSGLEEKGDDHDHIHLHDYLHLHDGVGHVIHRHKPGLSLQEFFDSLGFEFKEPTRWRMFVNTIEHEFDLNYVFNDTDYILLSNAAGSAEVLDQLEQMTRDACLYSRTCPWRGEPPAENCIADPSVPCVAPEETWLWP
ncbi:hypothetical protein HYZ98_00375 [Candidatus Peregrinibacteria bacterium]|nr:hypothetical protein [Candidatus Peregrinibacteria bacterium]